MRVIGVSYTDDSEKKATRWLADLISPLREGVEVTHTANNEVAPYKCIEVPTITSKVKPDITVFSKNAHVFFAKVLSSNNIVHSTRKLCFVLLLQLMYVRSYKDVSSVSGVVLPTIKDGCNMVLVTVTWKPEQFRFVAELKPIVKENIEGELQGIITSQIDTVDIPPSANIPIYFSDILTKDDMMKLFGDNSLNDLQFFRAKLSVVCYSRSHDVVFKRSLLSRTLAQFCFTCVLEKHVLKQVLLPVDKAGKFYKFPLLCGPLSISVIRSCFKSFAQSVHRAISELHNTGYAHMDIRIPNICYGLVEDQWEAILIDLDNVTDTPDGNEASVMYNTLFADARMYDWRQYAIMLARIIEGNDRGYHKWVPSFPNTNFGVELRKSFESGIPPSLTNLPDLIPDQPQTLQDVFT